MSIEKYRKLFAVESMAIFQGLLESLDVEYLVTDPSNPRIVEIGAGTGQLRSWIPASLQQVVVHTEPLLLAISQFQRRWPEANIIQAKAECLPFMDAEAALVMGLCVLDVVDDGVAVAREIARVLRPGGHFVHMLDLSTDLSSVFYLFSDG